MSSFFINFSKACQVKYKKTLISLGSIAFLSWSTNPSDQSFSTYFGSLLTKQIDEDILKDLGVSKSESENFFQWIDKTHLSDIVTKKKITNYGFFKITSMDLDLNENNNKKTYFIGIANNWFRL